MDEYLNKQELLNALETDYNSEWGGVEEYINGARDEYDDVLNIICSAPVIDVQLMRHGEWLNQYEFCKKNGYTASGIGLYYWCSNCGKAEQKKSDYCPNCGAQMDLGGEIQSNKANIE
jgi:hypothetical protein